MAAKIKQYKNLIFLIALIVVLIVALAVDPAGFFVERAHQRAQIRNQIAIEKAETEKRIAIIQAEAEAELVRIRNGFPLEDAEPEQAEEDTVEVDTPSEG